MTKYLIVIEKAGDNYSAYVPDVPGCVAAGDTVEETKELMIEALTMHFEGMSEDGDPIPQPTTVAEYVEVKVPSAATRKSA